MNYIFVSTDCSLVTRTSYCLNTNLFLNLCAVVVLQPVITLVANSVRIKILLRYFFRSSASSYQCFLWFEGYFTVVTRKYL